MLFDIPLAFSASYQDFINRYHSFLIDNHHLPSRRRTGTDRWDSASGATPRITVRARQNVKEVIGDLQEDIVGGCHFEEGIAAESRDDEQVEAFEGVDSVRMPGQFQE